MYFQTQSSLSSAQPRQPTIDITYFYLSQKLIPLTNTLTSYKLPKFWATTVQSIDIDNAMVEVINANNIAHFEQYLTPSKHFAC